MIHLHHSGEDAVVVLAKQLRDHERIYFKLVAYRDRIDLQLVLSLLHTGGVRHLVRRYHESRPVRETGGECRRGKGTGEHGVMLHLQVLHPCRAVGEDTETVLVLETICVTV